MQTTSFVTTRRAVEIITIIVVLLLLHSMMSSNLLHAMRVPSTMSGVRRIATEVRRGAARAVAVAEDNSSQLANNMQPVKRILMCRPTHFKVTIDILLHKIHLTDCRSRMRSIHG